MGLHLTDRQQEGWEILTDQDATRVLFDGGARSGKTALVIEYMVMRALRFPGCRQLIARKKRVHAYASIWNDTLRRYLADFVPSRLYQKRTTPLLSVAFSNGSEILVDGLDSDDRVDKVLGNEYTTVYLNEARQMSYTMVQRLLTRLAQRVEDRQGHQCIPKLLLDTNPSGPRHWLHRVGIERVYPDSMEPLVDADHWARLNWSALDNLENLPPEFIQSLDALPDVERQRMRDGKWVQPDGLVYPLFATCLADKPDEPPAGERYGAIDWGFAAPFCALWGVLDREDVLWITGCRYKRRTSLSVHARRIPKGVIYWADPAGADQITEFRRADHVVRKAHNDILNGIQAVTHRMATNRLRIVNVPAMRPLIEEAESYAYPEDTDIEKPEDKDNHAMDALRYLVAGVDRGRTAVTETDDGDEANEQPTEQERYADAPERERRPREDRLPEDHPMSDSDGEWNTADNESIWTELV